MRKAFLYTISVILRQACLIAALQLIGFYCKAQSSYTGYHSSSYTGVYGILNNPSEILNHRQRADINLAGVAAALGNNIFSFRYKSREDDKGGFRFSDPISKNGKANINTDILGRR